jgi:hypothetical protein
MTTQLKFSEAVRLGAMATPQAFGTLTDQDGGTCGVGAAVRAAGCRIVPTLFAQQFFGENGLLPLRTGLQSPLTVIIPIEWGAVLSQESHCPECGLVLVVSQLITHLNDEHRWPRTRQADFVEAIEQKLENPREQQTAVPA